MIAPEVKSTIITLLSHEDAAVRRQAAEELSISTSLMVSAVLSLALQDKDKGVRDSAARSLLQIRTKSVPYAVVEYLTDSSFITRNLASELMVKIGSDSIVPLLDYTHHENQDVRKLAIDTIGLIKDKSAVPSLLTLLHDQDANVVVAVVEALGNIRDEYAIPYLTMAYVCYPYARVVIAEAIGKIGSSSAEEFLVVLLEELQEPEGEDLLVVFSLIEALANVGNERALGVIVPLIKKTTGPLQHILLYAFVQIATRNNIPLSTYIIFKPYLLSALLSTDIKVVIAAVQSLVQMMDDAVEEYLLSILGKNEEVDAIILGNLHNIGKAFVLLAERYEASAFDQKKNIMGFIIPRVREISENSDKEMFRVRASLFDALAIDWNESDEEMRLMMVDALFYLDEERAFAFFSQLVEGVETWMRVTLLETIAGGSHVRINDLLLKFSNDQDEEVREFAHAVLNSRGLMIEDSETSGSI
jgi:HEAT repeat protein